MAVGGDPVHRRLLHVERSTPEALDGIDEKYTPRSRQSKPSVQVVAGSRWRIRRTDRKNPGACIHAARRSSIETRGCRCSVPVSNFDAAIRQVHPGILVRRVFLGRERRRYRRLSREPLGDDGDASRP